MVADSSAMECAAAINSALVAAGLAVFRLEPVRQSLEQRFLEVTSRLSDAPSRGDGMNATIAAQMTGADILKLRKKRGILIWSLVLALGPILIYFIAAVIEHASNPGKYGPAGGCVISQMECE